MNENNMEVHCDGFPVELRPAVQRVSMALGESLHANQFGDKIQLASQAITLPRRVSVSDSSPTASRFPDRVESTIASCLLSRDGDGFVRERQIAGLMSSSESWAAPYFLALLGDYVLEIHEAMVPGVLLIIGGDAPRQRIIGELLARNSGWWKLLQNRVISHRARYHWLKYPMDLASTRSRRLPDDYPAARVARLLGQIEGVPQLERPLR